MKQHRSPRVAALFALLALALAAGLPASALFFTQDSPEETTVAAFSKNALLGQSISFSPADFVVESGEKTLDSILLATLPDYESGVLTLGGAELPAGTAVSLSALSGLRFQALRNPSMAQTAFTFTPIFSDGTAGKDVTVGIYLLSGENGAPVAENLSLSTYRNVPITGRFSAVDPEGDLLTFRLAEKPARGSVAISEEGGCDFVYTPFENKSGKDSFTYVAVDAVGNTSAPATVTIRIEKAKTRVTYADLDGSPAGKAAIRLAEEGIFVGECRNDTYFFRPDQIVTRTEFLSMALNAAGEEALSAISRTGFADDEAIPTWAKGYVAAGLKTGAVKGSLAEDGQVVFQGENPVTRAEASVLLNRILHVTDAAVPTFYADSSSIPAWAYQAAVNLETAGILRTDANGALSLSDTLTRADAAELLAGALDLLESRESASLF